ncbi:vacuolar carboxypeptidase-like protein Cps1 [Polyplosphaeria fusca]|uniref:Vacuolar carboxypeptidase-like protein Cps1 n=1 Tax=Polyplosphaeria fusca TaxID=682080 RepID=A0A9P4R1U9_9PLEO|nr:vacuolar carboxypeptidase-like protein Cps1 [Polyplosphaeria fusca]
MEKSSSQIVRKPFNWRRDFDLRPLICCLAIAGIVLYSIHVFGIHPYSTHSSSTPQQYTTPKCVQIEPLFPKITTKELDAFTEYLTTDDFRNKSIARLAGAVQIPTETFDDMGEVGFDPRWDVFPPLAAYLEKTFPLVHSTLQLEKINIHGLLFTWAGTDPSLKPSVLMAHQDVVPVAEATIGQWAHPPFSGFYDGKFIWGRGASDCKNTLVGILEAVEGLIEAGFTPRRTLVLSFGFDEEISGQEGANHLAPFLVKRYGHHGVVAIVDEGATYAESWGASFAIPGVAEKGDIDVDVVVRLPGGHSSIPPEHTGIGVAAELISLIEANPYEPHLDERNPFLGLLECGAEHAPDFPKKLKKLLHKRDAKAGAFSKDPLALEAAKAGPGVKYLMTTSVAIDLIHGGVKTNALPERTSFTVNHRINVGSCSSVILEKISHLASQIAHKYNLTVNEWNKSESPSSITLSYRDTLLEPAPVTPTFSASDPDKALPYHVLAGTTRALYDVYVAPGIMTGNTDTRYYWDLSEHIFRFNPGWDREQVGLGRIHTVDEKIGVQAHVDSVRWVVGWVRNVDEVDL